MKYLKDISFVICYEWVPRKNILCNAAAVLKLGVATTLRITKLWKWNYFGFIWQSKPKSKFIYMIFTPTRSQDFINNYWCHQQKKLEDPPLKWILVKKHKNINVNVRKHSRKIWPIYNFRKKNLMFQGLSALSRPFLYLCSVVPKLFQCADHLEYFTVPQKTKYWFK